MRLIGYGSGRLGGRCFPLESLIKYDLQCIEIHGNMLTAEVIECYGCAGCQRGFMFPIGRSGEAHMFASLPFCRH